MPFVSDLFYGEILGMVIRRIGRTLDKLKA